MVEGRSNVVKGCIKATRGPWLIRKITKSGGIITKLRNPSDRERQNNTARERKRRSITKRIFAGLKAHGNYHLPKNADHNDLLKALCAEAGWHVGEDGTVHKKNFDLKLPKLINIQPDQYVGEDESYYTYKFNSDVEHVASKDSRLVGEGCDINLSLSL